MDAGNAMAGNSLVVTISTGCVSLTCSSCGCLRVKLRPWPIMSALKSATVAVGRNYSDSFRNEYGLLETRAG